MLAEEGVPHPVSSLGLCDVGVWRKQRDVIGISCELLEIADLDVEPDLFKVLTSELFLWNLLWQLNFGRLFRRLILHFRSFLGVLSILFLFLLLLFLLLDLGFFLLGLLDLHILLTVKIRQGNVLSYVGVVDGQHRKRVSMRC